MRIEHAGARAVELEPMIGALDAVAADDLAHVQRREAMRAAILQRSDAAICGAVEDDRLLEDGAREQRALGEIVGPGRDVPGIAQIGAADHLPLALAELAVVRRRARHRSFLSLSA